MANLVDSMKKAALEAVESTKPVAVFFGTVISVSPLKIDVEQKLTLTIEQLILARNVTDYQTWFSFDDTDIKQRVNIFDKPEDEPVIKPTIPPPIIQTTKHLITHYNHLRKDEKVILLRMQDG